MPTYEYRCEACGHEFEKFQSIKAEPIRKCPECGKNKVHRLIGTGAGLIFKGSGFYITDYRDSSYQSKAKAEGGGESKGESKSSETKTAETKAESKAESKPAAPAAKSTKSEARNPKQAQSTKS